MPKKTRKRLPVQEKAAILRLHLLEHTPVSDLCDQYDIHPTMFSRWQKELFENAAAALEPRTRRARDDKDRRIAALEQKLQRKNEVLSELMEEQIKRKKELGELGTEPGFPSRFAMRLSHSSTTGRGAPSGRSGGGCDGWDWHAARSTEGADGGGHRIRTTVASPATSGWRTGRRPRFLPSMTSIPWRAIGAWPT
jgi:transposase